MAAAAQCGDAEEPSLVWVAVRYRAALVAIALAAGSLLQAYDTSTPLLPPPPEPRYGKHTPRLGLTACAPPQPPHSLAVQSLRANRGRATVHAW
jgi:hypothetical protein